LAKNDGFTITSDTDTSGVIVITINGQITTQEARQMTVFFRKLHSRGVREVVIDLTGVTYACSAALAFFISVCGGHTRDEMSFNAAFCGLPANVLRAIESLGLAHLLNIAPDKKNALKLLLKK
jgi:anti-anti-sigma factor